MGWLSGWTYRRSRIVTPHASAGTNERVEVKVYINPYNLWDFVCGFNGYSNNPVLAAGSGDWDDKIRELGNILYEPNDTGKEYKMFYSGYDGGAAGVYVGYAYSSDGINWTKANIVVGDLGRLNINRHLEDPYVVKVGSTYHLYVEDKDTYNGEKPIRKYHTNDLEGAWVDDGIVLSNTDPDAEAWENALVGSPIVWVEGSTWYMLYEGYAAPATGDTGLATSSDGVSWTRDLANNPVFTKAGLGGPEFDADQTVGMDLWKIDGKYYMSYTGFNAGTGEVHNGICYSEDLINWTRHPNNPLHPYSCTTGCQHLQVVYDGTRWMAYWYHTDTSGVYMAYPSTQGYLLDKSVDTSITLDSAKVRADFGDIRFTDNDGTTELNYELKHSINGQLAIFWVEVQDDLSGSNVTIYMYYDKSDATTTSANISEDFLDYTEVDTANDRVQRTGDPSHHIDHMATQNEDTYVYKDFTANYFRNSLHYVDVQPVNRSGSYVYFSPWILSNTTPNDLEDLYTYSGGSHFICVWMGYFGTRYVIALRECNGMGNIVSQSTLDPANPFLNTWHYLRIEKSGTSLKCRIWRGVGGKAARDANDACDSTYVTELSITLASDLQFRYLYPANTWNNNQNEWFDYNVENLLFTNLELGHGGWGSEELAPAPENIIGDSFVPLMKTLDVI